MGQDRPSDGEEKRNFRGEEGGENPQPEYPQWDEGAMKLEGAATDRGESSPGPPSPPPRLPDVIIPTSGMVPQPHDRGYNKDGAMYQEEDRGEDCRPSLWRRMLGFLRGGS